MTAPKTDKVYSVTVEGYCDGAIVEATDAGGARWRVYRQMREAGSRMTFREFLDRCSTLHLGRASPDWRTPYAEIPF